MATQYQLPASLIKDVKAALIKLGYANSKTSEGFIQDAYFKYIMVRHTGQNPNMPYSFDLLPAEIKSQLGINDPVDSEVPYGTAIVETISAVDGVLTVKVGVVGFSERLTGSFDYRNGNGDETNQWFSLNFDVDNSVYPDAEPYIVVLDESLAGAPYLEFRFSRYHGSGRGNFPEDPTPLIKVNLAYQ